MTGIIVAMDIELKALLSSIQNKSEKIISGITFTRGIIAGEQVVAAVCGIGKVASAVCAQTMILSFSPDRVINCGVCGGLADDLEVGDVILASDAVQYDMDTSALGDPKGFLSGLNIINIPCSVPEISDICEKTESFGKIRVGRVASGDKFISELSEKIQIRAEFSADVCEMEGASVAQVCFINGIPCTLVRTVSDSLSGSGADYEIFKYRCADISCELVKKIISSL